MAAARGTNERATGCELVVSAFLAARAAFKAGAAKANLHDVLKAGVVIGEALKELADREVRRRGTAFLCHPILTAQLHTCVTGINGISIG